MKEYQADTDYFSIQNIKPIPIPVLKYQAITDAKNQGKVSFLNRILTETQYKCNIMSCMGQKKRMMTREDYKWFGKSGTFLLMLNIKPIPIPII